MLLCYYYNIHRAILNRNLEKYVVWVKGRPSILWVPCHCSVASVCGNTVHGPQRVNVLVAYDLGLRLQCFAKEPALPPRSDPASGRRTRASAGKLASAHSPRPTPGGRWPAPAKSSSASEPGGWGVSLTSRPSHLLKHQTVESTNFGTGQTPCLGPLTEAGRRG